MNADILQYVHCIFKAINTVAISQLEQKETLDKDMLERIAKILKVPAEAFRYFSEESAINVISSTFHNNSSTSVNNNSFLTRLINISKRSKKSRNCMKDYSWWKERKMLCLRK